MAWSTRFNRIGAALRGPISVEHDGQGKFGLIEAVTESRYQPGVPRRIYRFFLASPYFLLAM
ncbi:hypothetical protein L1889_02775 [Paenalcaligenes niemegkensis]|uniref:hypothetical protein n=1 Tax=Paenalcaligenes niemegkensis TaxID=2895469 RepID=UPI001EE8A0A7|nr:hypothetical protein [Paenalcaligenes niemegkensis]MCQ9615771.1 hypothetical protein [Paenalcaligenes niemegkensis]